MNPLLADDFTEASAPQQLVAKPVVSVLMLAYNHGQWIAEAIESVLAQDCGFEYELIIGEDGSGDDTLAIASRYQQRYPDRIRVVYPPRNTGFHANHRRVFALARGEFIAYCEGDDYWCRCDKLTAQVALLRAQPQAAMVHADWVRSRPFRAGWRVDWCRPMHRWVPLSRLQGDLFTLFYFPKVLRTCTLMQRRAALEEFYSSALAAGRYRFIDTAMAAYMASKWQTAYWSEVAAVYRESPNSALRSGRRAFLQFLRSGLEFDSAARAFFVGRAGYPTSYRWENAVGLLLKAARLGDLTTMREAWRDLAANYGPIEFLRAGFAAARMRWPALRRNRRALPPASNR